MRAPLPTPLALPLHCAHDFLHFVLSNTNNNSQDLRDQKSFDPTTLLIICSTRDQFIHNLLTASHSPPLSPSPSPSPSPLHHLPHVSILSASSNIRIIFTPTIHHLRAYLTTLVYTPPTSTFSSSSSNSSNEKNLYDQKPPILAIWGLVEAHSSTTEYSAQGIGRTVATAVSAGVRNGMWVVVGGRGRMKRLHQGVGVEEFYIGDGGGETVLGEEGGATKMDVQVPVLNSTVKLGKEMDIVARGRVSVKDIFQRWFIWKEKEEKQENQEEGGEIVHGVEDIHIHIHDGSKVDSEVGESDNDEL